MTAHGAQIGEVNLETPEFGLILWMKAQDLPIQQLADSTTDVVRPVNIPSKPGGRSGTPWWMRILQKHWKLQYECIDRNWPSWRVGPAKVEEVEGQVFQHLVLGTYEGDTLCQFHRVT